MLAARSEDKLTTFVNELKNNGIDSIGVVTDVSNEEQCKNLIKKALDAYGKIDIMLNNAGISMRALFKDVDLSVLKQVMDINFWGTVYCTKYALDEVIKNKGSVIISSIAGYKACLAERDTRHLSLPCIFLESIRIELLKKCPCTSSLPWLHGIKY